jgi:hypothetical protein
VRDGDEAIGDCRGEGGCFQNHKWKGVLNIKVEMVQQLKPDFGRERSFMLEMEGNVPADGGATSPELESSAAAHSKAAATPATRHHLSI